MGGKPIRLREKYDNIVYSAVIRRCFKRLTTFVVFLVSIHFTILLYAKALTGSVFYSYHDPCPSSFPSSYDSHTNANRSLMIKVREARHRDWCENSHVPECGSEFSPQKNWVTIGFDPEKTSRCTYRGIYYQWDLAGPKYERPRWFQALSAHRVGMNVTHDMFEVQCYDANKKPYCTDLHMVVEPNLDMPPYLEKDIERKQAKGRLPDIFIFTVPEMPLNEARTMYPQLNSKWGFIPFLRATNFGELLRENLIALWTGMLWEDVPHVAQREQMPWLYKDLQEYKSLFVQFKDRNIFQEFFNGGFDRTSHHVPFTHYYRPIMQYSEQTQTCISQDRHAYTLLKTFSKRYQHKQPLFSFMDLESVAASKFIPEVLALLEESGRLDNAYVFFMSGRIHEEIPLFAMRTPKDFKYTENVNILAKRQLVTPIDFYWSIKYLINGETLLHQEHKTLFHTGKSALQRSCSEARVPEYMCQCNRFGAVDVSNDQLLMLANKVLYRVVEQINQDIGLFAKTNECQRWQLIQMNPFATEFGLEDTSVLYEDTFKSPHNWPRPGILMKARIIVDPNDIIFLVNFEWRHDQSVRLLNVRRAHDTFPEEAQTCIPKDIKSDFDKIVKTVCCCKESEFCQQI